MLNEANEWTYVWKNLPEKRSGTEIAYTVEELTKAKGYTVEITGDMDKGFTITNTHVVETLTLEGKKVWEDNDDEAGDRPESITVRLHANGVEVAHKEVSAAEKWVFRFDDLHKYECGVEIHYTITEDAISEYSTEIDKATHTITNKYTPGKTSVTVSKIWDDNDNAAGYRPASVQVQLLADGEAYGGPVTLSDENEWEYIWEELPEKKDGKTVSYTVEELTDAERYTNIVEGDAVTGFLVKNVYEEPAPEGGGDDRDRRTPETDPPAEPTEEPVEEPTEIDDPEVPQAGTEVEPEVPEDTEEVVDEEVPLTPFTGDDRHTGLWMGISLLSLAGILLLGRRRREE